VRQDAAAQIHDAFFSQPSKTSILVTLASFIAAPKNRDAERLSLLWTLFAHLSQPARSLAKRRSSIPSRRTPSLG
jgi:hypothetical protein